MAAAAQVSERGRPIHWVISVLVLQIGAAAFFVADALADFAQAGLSVHTAAEGIIALGLAGGVAMGLLYLRRLFKDRERERATNAAARGAFGDLVRARFESWGLTSAEAEVALFALKGFDTAEIARLRATAEGTVRAQLTKVYAKAGTSSRTGFVSLFIEDLLAGEVAGETATDQSPSV